MEKTTGFDIEFDDGRVASCWVAESQEYQNTTISAGLVKKFPPDDFFLRFERVGEEPTTIFLREDEVAAVIHCLAGALWSKGIFDLSDE